jgi:hypothetical protein
MLYKELTTRPRLTCALIPAFCLVVKWLPGIIQNLEFRERPFNAQTHADPGSSILFRLPYGEIDWPLLLLIWKNGSAAGLHYYTWVSLC